MLIKTLLWIVAVTAYLLVGAIILRLTLFREINNGDDAAALVVWSCIWPIFFVLYAMMFAGEKAVEWEERRKK